MTSLNFTFYNSTEISLAYYETRSDYRPKKFQMNIKTSVWSLEGTQEQKFLWWKIFNEILDFDDHLLSKSNKKISLSIYLIYIDVS